MWSKIFKSRSSSKSASSTSSKDRRKHHLLPLSASNSQQNINNFDCSRDDDEFRNAIKNNYCEMNFTTKPSLPAVSNGPVKKSSKIAKVVNSFSLKRGPKGNRNAVTIIDETNCKNSMIIASAAYASEVINVDDNNFEILTEHQQQQYENLDQIVIKGDQEKPDKLYSEIPSEPVKLELQPCPICTRTFVPDTLKKHVDICERMALKKRNKFDSSRQRRTGTELENFLPKGYGLPKTKQLQDAPHHHNQQQQQSQQSQKNSYNKPTTYATKSIHSAPMSSIGAPKQYHQNNVEQTIKKISPQNKSIISYSHLHNTFPSTTTFTSSKEKSKPERKRHLLPQSEPCPYCERCFGPKAYDRHVEWCKEKTRLLANKNPTKTPAKERLEARIKYRAPCVKSKRKEIKEKYSGLNCDDSISVADSFDTQSKSSRDNHHRKLSLSTSINSSIMSERSNTFNLDDQKKEEDKKMKNNKKGKTVISDNYDPFLSAKRQLEELCSDSSILEPPITPIASISPPNKFPTNLSTSFTAESTHHTTPSSSNPKTQSNFRRTSSLRVSRKKYSPTTILPSRPLIYSQSKNRPSTIQRGISDEGPISSNFLRPEEYDEMPVKSACVNDLAISALHHHNHQYNTTSPKVVKRDTNSNANRRNIRLNKVTTTNDKSSLSDKSVINPVSKTDSLAIFLKYENETKENASSSFLSQSLPEENSPVSTSTPKASDSVKLSEKELKDKTNTTLSKNNLLTSTNPIITLPSAKTKLLPSMESTLRHNEPNKLDRDIKNNDIDSIMTINKIHPIKLEPLPKTITLPIKNTKTFANTTKSDTKNSYQEQKQSISLNLNLILNSKDSTDFIDPNLINICDNLPINITKISSDSSDLTSSSTDSVSTTKFSNLQSFETQLKQHQQQLQEQQKPIKTPQTSSNRNSNEKRNLLKRRLRLDKNQFLYDVSPQITSPTLSNINIDIDESNIDPYSVECEKTLSMCSTKLDDTGDNNEPIFDEFDFEEFLSSFDENDEEQFPVFKDYKKFLMMNRNFNKQLHQQQQQLNNLNDSKETPIHNDEKNLLSQDCNGNELRKSEIFISIETNQNDECPESLNSYLQQQATTNDGRLEVIETDGTHDEDEEFKKINESYDDNEFIYGTKNENVKEEDDVTKSKFEEYEKINEELNQKNESNEQQQQEQLESPSSNDLMYELLQDSDEISSSIDEQFSSNERKQLKLRQNADSAYGSLSRYSPTEPVIQKSTSKASHKYQQKQPLVNDQTISQIKPKHSSLQMLQRNDMKIQRNRNLSASSSSSSSDNLQLQSQNDKDLVNSTPIHKQITDTTNKINNNKNCNKDNKMSKFCHECGSKFIITQAKFCMECGVRRIVIE